MKIILATGVYPPELGGPATYVKHLAEELSQKGVEVVVIAYGKRTIEDGKLKMENENGWKVIHVARRGGSLIRWWRYARALRKHGHDADIVYAFSSVSVGVPLWLSLLKKPKRILRLGGDFFWERYTDLGGRLPLHAWYALKPKILLVQKWILKKFDFLIFSTDFQARLYEIHYRGLPTRTVLENALPEGEAQLHLNDDPFRLLFMGRLVKFKNLATLLTAVAGIPHVHLTIVGDGPVGGRLMHTAAKLGLGGRVAFLPPVHGEDKNELLQMHQLLILPSITEISPNVALEARASGLPVLLTEETGLSEELHEGMVLRSLLRASDITRAILEIQQNYEEVARAAVVTPKHRSWEQVAEEHLSVFQSLL